RRVLVGRRAIPAQGQGHQRTVRPGPVRRDTAHGRGDAGAPRRLSARDDLFGFAVRWRPHAARSAHVVAGRYEHGRVATRVHAWTADRGAHGCRLGLVSRPSKPPTSVVGRFYISWRPMRQDQPNSLKNIGYAIWR